MDEDKKCVYPHCRQLAVVRPVVVVPVLNWPHPAFVVMRKGICEAHRYQFSLKDFTDYEGSWYDHVRAELEGYKKECKDPVTGIVTVVSGGYKPAEIVDCTLVFREMDWEPRRAKLWR